MTVSLKHKFTSLIPDAGDPTIVQPSNWNDEHALTQATETILGRVSALTGDTEELTPAQVRALLNVADGATANSSDAFLLARANHTGTQLAATISDFATAASLVCLPLAGGTMTGKLVTDASEAVLGAGFNVPHGIVPNAPADGDFWTTAAFGLYVRVNGVTKAMASLDNASQWTIIQTFKTSSTTAASIRLPHGVAPNAPANGDMWTATTGLFYRINGVTQTALSVSDAAAAYQPLTANLTSWGAIARAANFDAFVAAPSSANLRTLLTDEVGTGSAYFVGGALGTPASGVATNLTGLPIATGVSGLAAGIAAFLATPSSANLRAALTDEVGTGAAYFVGGALGTPASGVASNMTTATAAPGTNNTQIASTAFVTAAVAAVDFGAGNAALAFGAVGTYAQVFSLTATLITEGLTMAGSTLQPAGFSEAVTTDPGDDTTYGSGGAPFIKGGTALSGTWRAMGRVSTGGGAIRRRTFLAMRIS
ncbi:hypothetical protein EN904_13440 [Mesorhizobium sp. M7A.F.Ca.CA.001.07.2.1]|uniref:hypothetical protein n=3 Tax=Phyllobacteriaceae TaxID=69277 RepID=UPI000FCB4185|nr:MULTISPECIES: hypothetical protein [Mesorhizobium]MCF6124388.1 hypothetical protein [Mesorhizobium ciceri]MCQ8816651.1 hypothetical protein [Mesorhizobium sp. SEMIA396]RUX82450.1 hypothetical protein EN983_01055 [Mesorhizobium sp. M7A.F.Ca.CA.004.08.2.1]RUX87213.1 hypothetical protein EN982_11720 [Mesorhizobium sp. M7A.F.Ca.CA.004.08.1.1]RUY56675.1 hypothetical protein EN973_08835 [Mesorhizobium sp. M7A.F.Ca.CA.001.12.1.1]